MNFKKKLFFFSIALCVAMATLACKPQNCPDVPKPGTTVTSQSPAFTELARSVQDQCAQMGGCTCILDGIQTNCNIVFACLEAGFCELVATQ